MRKIRSSIAVAVGVAVGAVVMACSSNYQTAADAGVDGNGADATSTDDGGGGDASGSTDSSHDAGTSDDGGSDSDAPDRSGCGTSSDPNNCGACGTVCSGNNIPVRTCASGVCNGTCAAGTTNCNNTKQMNGCNVSTSTDPNNCGACGVVCSGNNIPTRTCASGLCNGTCATGTASCDGTKQINGCNVDIANDPNNCGACGTVCSGNNMLTRTCGGSVCNGMCSGGFGDCNLNLQTDGCEVATTTATNCSGCGLACNTTTNSARTCSGGTTCTYTCNAGRADCNVATAPDLDGCECAHPTCGGNGCANTTVCPSTTHSNGVGQSFYDCTAVGTFNVGQALEACTAFAISQGNNATFCFDGWQCAGVPTVCYSIDGGVSPSTHCWGYTGAPAGKVGGTLCPFTQTAVWN